MLKDKLKSIKEELNEFDDSFTQYAFIVELSAYVPAEIPEIMTDEYKYKGCQSQVWLKLEDKAGAFNMLATSDTLLIRGILYIMSELYNGEKIEEIANMDFDFLKECSIEEHFNSERTVGIKKMNEEIKNFCKSCCKND
ncbi:MAG: SufE family protein [Parasporobacterium sp.]|nr:SufE family protein [Parasporobacterium sp.]